MVWRDRCDDGASSWRWRQAPRSAPRRKQRYHACSDCGCWTCERKKGLVDGPRVTPAGRTNGGRRRRSRHHGRHWRRGGFPCTKKSMRSTLSSRRWFRRSQWWQGRRWPRPSARRRQESSERNQFTAESRQPNVHRPRTECANTTRELKAACKTLEDLQPTQWSLAEKRQEACAELTRPHNGVSATRLAAPTTQETDMKEPDVQVQ